jgi:hypothetical protein
MKTKIAIQGNPIRGADVIKILESLGGINRFGLLGVKKDYYYFINNNKYIDYRLKKCIHNYHFYTLEEYEQKFNNIEKRNIQIDLTTAKEWYNKGGQLKEIALQAFSKEELQSLPKSWEEYCEINPYLTKDKEFFLAPDGTINNILQPYYRRIDFSLAMSSKKKAEQFVVLSKLIQIRDYYNQGWEPNWNDDTSKYTIGVIENNLYFDITTYSNKLFTFKSKEIRDEFFVNFALDLEFIKEFL